MSDRPQSPSTDETLFEDQVAAKAVRKLRAQSRGPGDVWFGLGMTGLIGWSIAVPTVLGALLGLWIDARHPAATPGHWRCWSPGYVLAVRTHGGG